MPRLFTYGWYAGAGLVNSGAMTHVLDLLISRQTAMAVSLVSNLIQFAAGALSALSEKTEQAEQTEQTETGTDAETDRPIPGPNGIGGFLRPLRSALCAFCVKPQSPKRQ